ncbi:hypothetical protein BJ170DRAFT_177157 [Xylariales sp. AK1849]|nr:hypothetical protein BJ170DRAFT_177157 [Xylariales sp. AK1849]
MAEAARTQVIRAPSQEAARHSWSVFLAGTTSGPTDWREILSNHLSDLPVTIFNPLRPDWNSSWAEDITFAPYREQVEWELEKQEKADIVAVYFGAGTDAPISLLELGLCTKEKKAIVHAQDGYEKKGNVQIVCQKYGVEIVDRVEDFRTAIMKKMGMEDGKRLGDFVAT